MTTTLSVGQVNSWRLRRHHLTLRAPRRDLPKVVSDVGGIQAQVLSSAELAIRARVEGVRQEDVKAALWRDRTILKTWCMRGTLHLLSASDFPLYVAALRSKLADSKRWLEKVEGVAPSEVDAITESIGRTLSQAPMSREDLSRAVEKGARFGPRTRKALRSPWGVLLRPAAYRGALTFGESVGPRATFISPPQVVGARGASEGDAFEELYRRFLHCYGPAGPNEFAHWWGGLREVKAHLAATIGGLERVRSDGFEGFMLSRDAEEASGLEPPRGVSLLPSFDCYAMFYAPRGAFVSPLHRARIFRKAAGWNYPALVVDGTASGVWSLKKKGRRRTVIVEQFRSLGARERSCIQDEAEGIGRFLDTPVDVRFGGID